MTREEVAEWLKFMQEDEHNKADSIVPCTNEIALGIAIEALKQPQIVRCKDCKHRPTQKKCFPDTVCPCQCSDSYYSWVPPDDWYCADGERKGGDGE